MNAPLPDTCPRCGSAELIEVRCSTGPHYARLHCRACAREDRPSYLRFVPAPLTPERAAAWVLPFGKHRGLTLAELTLAPGGVAYLEWCLAEFEGLSDNARRAIACHLEATRR